ncbi:MAG TPA: hypothetical protein VJV03_09725 [Pyrinomonadaceae bacterium]|nr:hypothetical protein [Pyrinomonadaceae bacterium]
MRTILLSVILMVSGVVSMAQEPTVPKERLVPLTNTAIALDGNGVAALEATLKTTALHGAEDSPVTNIRVVVRNASSIDLAFVSGLITFYDSAGVRCGEGIFKADALTVGEAFETDTPGIRIRCSPATWRIVATNLLPRVPPAVTTPPLMSSRSSANLIISVDGEEHPIQLDRPLVLQFGATERTIVVRARP